jgi:hypothetical protein
LETKITVNIPIRKGTISRGNRAIIYFGNPYYDKHTE